MIVKTVRPGGGGDYTSLLYKLDGKKTHPLVGWDEFPFGFLL